MTQSNQNCHATALPPLLAGLPDATGEPTLLRRLVVALQRWREYNRLSRELGSLDPRMLQDIGLTRSDVDYALQVPLWQVLARPAKRSPD